MKKHNNRCIKGTPFSPGYIIGSATLWGIPSLKVVRKKINKKDLSNELHLFEKAIKKAYLEIAAMREDLLSKIGEKEASIFDLQLLILEDAFLLEKIKRSLEKNLFNAEFTFYEILRQYYSQFSFSEDFYIRERWSDIEDIARRVLKHLSLLNKQKYSQEMEYKEEVILKNRIIIAKNILVSDFAKMHSDGAVGLVTCVGSQTSHVSILARSFKIPTLLIDEKDWNLLTSGDLLILDAILGVLWVNPTKFFLKNYEKKISDHVKNSYKLKQLKDLPSETIDHHNIELFANIERPEYLESALENGAQGIGLFRTEFLYMNRNDLPHEEEQYNVYRLMLEKLEDKPLIVRTLDIGGDKFSPQLNIPHEQNPALGCRGIRYCLENIPIFKVQLRALLRASVHGCLKIIFPMISGREELLLVCKIMSDVKKELLKEKKKILEKIPMGIMIETPSSAITADLFTDLVDFFSIGTNDLAQYTLAIDRGHEHAQSYSYRIHPSMLRLIKTILSSAEKGQIDVTLCGELSSDIIAIELLVGLGLKSFSVTHTLLPDVKKMIRSISLEHSKIFAKKLLSCKHALDLEREAKNNFQNLIKLK